MWLAPGLCLVLTGILFANAACTNPRVRSEWHELTSDQQSAFVAACKDLAAKPDSNQFTVATQMSWHDFVVAHSDNVFWAHGNAEFYPFHRAMVWMFEEAIMATGRLPTGMGVPYFDWSVRSQTWASSNIFSAAAFGAPNSGDPDGCVLDGAFAKGRYNVASAGSTTQNRNIMTGDLTCLRRAANKEATLDAKFLQQELSASSYVQFTSQDPVNPSGDYSSNTYFDSFDFHGSGHIALGGNGADMSNPSISPNDPIFWRESLVSLQWFVAY
ncbi:hypothetical protein BC830DRAFT_310774 [Chytriomyces sp. MP71]|nr:hypothetical protein BC830DRAFT_310774 [Chytriomyces sp. MP71]